MAKFVKHIPCPKCGSSDANAVYSDGSSFCFSCRKTKGAELSKLFSFVEEEEDETTLPYDCTQEYSQEALAWTMKYEIGPSLLLKQNNPIYYSPKRNQLVFSFLGSDGNTIGWQARNLGNVEKRKRYFTKGKFETILPIYYNTDYCGNKSLVLVEDCLSAIKVAQVYSDAMPVLGSDVSREKLTRIKRYYSDIVIFLDPNMMHHAIKINTRAQLLGMSSRIIQGDKDPKEYSFTDLYEILK